VHTADEPADVIRELGVHLDYATRGQVLRQALTGDDASAQARALAEELYAAAPARDLSFAPAAARVRAQAERLVAELPGATSHELAVSLAQQDNDVPQAPTELPHAARGELAAALAQQSDSELRARAERQAAQQPRTARHELATPPAQQPRTQAERPDTELPRAAREELATALAQQGDDGLRAVLETAWRHGLALDPWDVTVVGSTVFPMKDKTFEPVIAAVTAADWQPATAGR
jgi:hypothetical protein